MSPVLRPIGRATARSALVEIWFPQAVLFSITMSKSFHWFVKIRQQNLPCWCAIYKTMTESMPGQRVGTSPSLDSGEDPSSDFVLSEVVSLTEEDVSVRAIVGFRWRSQKATSEVNLDASLGHSVDFEPAASANSSFAKLATLIETDDDGDGLLIGTEGGCSENAWFGAGFTINGPDSSPFWLRDGSLVPLAVGGVESKLSGRKVSLHNLFRTFCLWPKWRFILSAITKFHDFSTPKTNEKCSEAAIMLDSRQ